MTETKKILLIGRSGRGKSTLANVITGMENKFKESGGSASETKKIQFEEFSDPEKEKLDELLNKLNKEEKVASEQSNLSKEDLQFLQKILQERIQNNNKYLIIDTPGIGDTKMSDNEVLDIIAEAVYLVKDGVSQVLFVIGGRFDQSEMATYNLLRTIIFDNDITKYTTIARTRFGEFKDKEGCEADIVSMIKEAKDKKIELEEDITKKTKKAEELKNLLPNNPEHKKLLKEIEKLKKELIATNLAEIIESCQEKVVHVDNPPIEIAGAEEDELKLNKRKRTRSRKVVLEHLKNSCQKDFYKPEKLKKLSAEITEDMDNLLRSRRELEEEMKKLKISDSSSIEIQSPKVEDIPTSNKSNSVTKKGKEPADKLEIKIGDNLAIGKIKELEDRKEKLKKEIAQKEKIIRQKVLKHILNNYGEISNELGGDIFMDSVIGEHNWEKISPEFGKKELVVKWLSNKFDYEQVQKWATALGNSFSPEYDAGFCAWLRDNKQLVAEKIKRLSHPYNIEQLRQEYAQQLAAEVGLLDSHKQKLNPVIASQNQQWLKEKEFKSENERQEYRKRIENIIKKKANTYDSSSIVKSSIEEMKIYSVKTNEDFITVVVKVNTALWAKKLASIWLPTGKIPKTVYNLWKINHKFDQEGERDFSITKIYSDEDLYEGAFSSLEKATEAKNKIIADLVQQQELIIKLERQIQNETQIEVPPK